MNTKKDVNIFELADLSTPWCIRVAVTLDIANLISKGYHEIDDLANKTNSKARILLLVMRNLVNKGIFIETEKRKFYLNKLSEELKNPDVQYHFNLQGLGGRMTNIWSTLLQFVKSGESYYNELYGRPYWEDLEHHPDIGREFDEFMGSIGHRQSTDEIDLTGGWENVKLVADVGGGTGSFIGELLLLHHELRGILIDLPSTAERAKILLNDLGVLNRVTVVSQSFFDPMPHGIDVIFLKGVLQDWPDPQVKLILNRCVESLNQNGRILIIDGLSVINNIPISSLLSGGIGRTLEEFELLINSVNLKILKSKALKSGHLLIECESK